MASDVATNITVGLAAALVERLGISAGILGGGLASGVATLGVGLVAGLIIDSLLDWLVESLGYDPAGEVEAQINLALDEFEGVFIHGDRYEPNMNNYDFGIRAKPDPGFFGIRQEGSDLGFFGINDGQTKGSDKNPLEFWLKRKQAASSKECRGFLARLLDVYE